MKMTLKYQRMSLELIGSGSFSKVYKDPDVNENGVVCVIKRIELKTLVRKYVTSQKVKEEKNDQNKFKFYEERFGELIESEVALLSALIHRNVVDYYGYDYDEERKIYDIKLGFCESGDLESVIKQKDKLVEYKTNGVLKSDVVLELAKDLEDAVSYIHSLGVVHRDIKPANILVTKFRERLVPKLSDFGFACLMPETCDLGLRGLEVKEVKVLGEKYNRLCGTPLYMSPDVLLMMAKGNKGGCVKYGFEIDNWSLGVTLYEAAIGKLPFHYIGKVNGIDDLLSIFRRYTMIEILLKGEKFRWLPLRLKGVIMKQYQSVNVSVDDFRKLPVKNGTEEPIDMAASYILVEYEDGCSLVKSYELI